MPVTKCAEEDDKTPEEMNIEVELATVFANSNTEEVPEIALSATPTMWELDEIPRSGAPPKLSGGKPLSIRLFRNLHGKSQEEDGCTEKAVEEGRNEALPTFSTPLRLDKLLPGQVVRWKETKTTYLYKTVEKMIKGETV